LHIYYGKYTRKWEAKECALSYHRGHDPGDVSDGDETQGTIGFGDGRDRAEYGQWWARVAKRATLLVEIAPAGASDS